MLIFAIIDDARYMITLTDGSILEAGVETFGKAQCFWKRKDIKSVDIPSGVKTIRKGSFYECVNLERVTIPYGVTTIEPEAFSGCRKLRHVTLPDSLKVIGPRAFTKSGLEEMILTPRIKQMGEGAFVDCPDLKRFVVPDGYKADSFGVYKDKVDEMIVPPELEHLCENSPRDEWYYRLKHKDLNELLHRMEADSGSFPVIATVSSIDEELDLRYPCHGDHCFVEPWVDGPFFTAKDAYEGLCGLLNASIKSIEPGDINLLAANLVIGYLEEGRPNPSDTFDLKSSVWDYAVCFHPLPGLRPGKPVYGVVATMWHSASFHPFEIVFCFERTKTAARERLHFYPSFDSYPFTQEKPEIREWFI